MGKCLSKNAGAEHGEKGKRKEDKDSSSSKKSSKKGKKSQQKQKDHLQLEGIPDSTVGENTSDLHSYIEESSRYAKPVMTSPERYDNNNASFREGRSGPSRPLKKYDRIVWIDEDNRPEKGTFKWTGTLDGEKCVGLELDKKRQVMFGNHSGKKLFSCKPGHRSVVPLYQVVLLKDFEALKVGYALRGKQSDPPQRIYKQAEPSGMSKYIIRSKDKEQSESEPEPPYPSKRKMKSMGDKDSQGFINGFKKTKVDDESVSSLKQQPSGSLSSATPTMSSSGCSGFIKPVPKKRIAQETGNPAWSPGDKIKFYHSHEEAEIVETKLEGSNLMTTIKYTDTSYRPGLIQSAALIDLMATSNLVSPPSLPPLHESLRRNSFLEAVTPEVPTQTGLEPKQKQKKTNNLDTEILSLEQGPPPPFKPVTPNVISQQNAAVQTVFNYSTPPTLTTSTSGNSSFTMPTNSSNRSAITGDVLDYIHSWSNKSDSNKDDLSYSQTWSESFRDKQRRAAVIGANKMKEMKLKSEANLNSKYQGTISWDDPRLMDRAFMESPLRSFDENEPRPLESPTLVKNLTRRNTFPQVDSPSSFYCSYPFSKERMEFFGMKPLSTIDNQPKVVGMELKRSSHPEPSTSTTVRVDSEIPKTAEVLQVKIANDPAERREIVNDSTPGTAKLNHSFEHQVPEESILENTQNTPKIGSELSDSKLKRKRRRATRPYLQKNALNMFSPFTLDDIQFGLGYRRGIEGMTNSCYLDATIFSMFYCTDVFDKYLLRSESGDERTELAKRYLRSMITHLRGSGFCDGDRVMKLRNVVNSDKVKGDFMDVEEFIFALFEETLKLPEFIHYYPDTKDYMSQIVIDNNDPESCSTVQTLLVISFKLQDNLKLVTIPNPAWIIEMPRSNGRLVHYKAIIPSLFLDMNELMMKDELNDSSLNRTCFCEIATPPFWTCKACHESEHINEKLIFCNSCKDSLIYTLHDELPHAPEPVIFNPSIGNGFHQELLRMELLAVICFRTSHYTAFVKCGFGLDSIWLYFDSMAGGSSKVEEVPQMNYWLQELENGSKDYRDNKIPARVRQIMTDSHIYIYTEIRECPKSTAV